MGHEIGLKLQRIRPVASSRSHRQTRARPPRPPRCKLKQRTRHEAHAMDAMNNRAVRGLLQRMAVCCMAGLGGHGWRAADLSNLTHAAREGWPVSLSECLSRRGTAHFRPELRCACVVCV
jgi:uncharacterized protein (UPF0261 family)